MTGIPNYFQTDNFTTRRAAEPTAYGVNYDPESLLTGAEAASGLTYADKRIWPSAEVYAEAVAGRISPELIPSIAPRVKVVDALANRLEALLNSSGLSPFASGSAVAL